MWSDNETLSDCINYNHLISAVTCIINNPNLLPCSIGVFGDWGSSKSSLMKMIEEKYKGKEIFLLYISMAGCLKDMKMQRLSLWEG